MTFAANRFTGAELQAMRGMRSCIRCSSFNPACSDCQAMNDDRRDLYCHDCRDWKSCTADEETPGSTWSCGFCGAGIKCDVCGEPWTLEHVCA